MKDFYQSLGTNPPRYLRFPYKLIRLTFSINNLLYIIIWDDTANKGLYFEIGISQYGVGAPDSSRGFNHS